MTCLDPLWCFILFAPGAGCYPRTEMDSSSWTSPLSQCAPLQSGSSPSFSHEVDACCLVLIIATSLQLKEKAVMFERVSSLFHFPQVVSAHFSSSLMEKENPGQVIIPDVYTVHRSLSRHRDGNITDLTFRFQSQVLNFSFSVFLTSPNRVGYIACKRNKIIV